MVDQGISKTIPVQLPVAVTQLHEQIKVLDIGENLAARRSLSYPQIHVDNQICPVLRTGSTKVIAQRVSYRLYLMD